MGAATPNAEPAIDGVLLADPPQALREAYVVLRQLRGAAAIDTAQTAAIVNLLETIVVYKLPALRRDEIQQMLELTDVDLKQTRFYQEVFTEGRQEGEASLSSASSNFAVVNWLLQSGSKLPTSVCPNSKPWERRYWSFAGQQIWSNGWRRHNLSTTSPPKRNLTYATRHSLPSSRYAAGSNVTLGLVIHYFSTHIPVA